MATKTLTDANEDLAAIAPPLLREYTQTFNTIASAFQRIVQERSRATGWTGATQPPRLTEIELELLEHKL